MKIVEICNVRKISKVFPFSLFVEGYDYYNIDKEFKVILPTRKVIIDKGIDYLFRVKDYDKSYYILTSNKKLSEQEVYNLIDEHVEG